MRKHIILLWVFLMAAGIARGQDIVATTSVISSVVKDITGDKIRVQTLVPPGSCPGHFDLKISHLKIIEKSGILFAHGYEEYLGEIRQSIKNPRFSPSIIKIEGNWLVPASQKEAYERITKILSERYPEHSSCFESNRKLAEDAIDITDRIVKKLIQEKKLSGMKVVCNNHIKEMLEYAGFNVAATYGRKEELTPSLIRNLIYTCKKERVQLVIDNIQAGPDTGKVFTEELRIPHVAISNFPGALQGTPTLRQTLYENITRIVRVYENKNKTD